MKIFKAIFPIITCLICIIGLITITAFAPADSTCKLIQNYTVSIHGTSNLHNWDENVGEVSGDGVINRNSDGSYDLASVAIKINVHSIKSTEGSGMDNNTYKALKADTYPEITFTLSAPLNSIQTSASAKPVLAKGNLTIAGVTKAITMVVNVSMPVLGELSFEGSQKIMMTDYNVKPPTALLGTIRAGDEITLNYKTNFTITN